MKTLQHFDYDDSALILKALSHPTRLRIVNLIRENKPCVKGIEEALGLAQPNISQHLSFMRDKGILSSRKISNQVFYRIDDSRTMSLVDMIQKVYQ